MGSHRVSYALGTKILYIMQNELIIVEHSVNAKVVEMGRELGQCKKCGLGGIIGDMCSMCRWKEEQELKSLLQTKCDCGHVFFSNERYCPDCGERNNSIRTCSKCGKIMYGRYCTNCGRC